MHTQQNTPQLASDYRKSKDVTSDVTCSFQATTNVRSHPLELLASNWSLAATSPGCLANFRPKKYSRHSEPFRKSVLASGNISGPMIKFLTANEVCEWLRLTRKALWELERSGELIPDRIGRRLRYREHEILNYLDNSREKNTLAINISSQSFETDWKALVQKTSIEPKSHTYYMCAI